MNYKIIQNDPNYNLVISFQGMSGGVFPHSKEKLPYLYYNLFLQSKLKNNYIFFKDNNQCYYHTFYNDIIKIIQEYVSLHKPKKITTIGQSAGGFASLLVGEMIKANKIITISPQINLEWYSFGSQSKQHKRLFNLQGNYDIPHTNLGELHPLQCPVEYWYPNKEEFDRYHFSFMDKTDPNLKVITFNTGHNIGAGIGKELFKNQILKTIS